jgi:hypothetical protein
VKIEVKTFLSRNCHPAVRTWGWKNGYDVAEFGPIADEVQRAFLAAHEAFLRKASEEFMREAVR